MVAVPGSIIVEDFETGEIKPSLEWKRGRRALNTEDATGKEIVFTLRGRGETGNIYVKLYFSVYDNIPVIRKRMEVVNRSGRTVDVDRFRLEDLAFAEPESPSGGDPSTFLRPNSM